MLLRFQVGRKLGCLPSQGLAGGQGFCLQAGIRIGFRAKLSIARLLLPQLRFLLGGQLLPKIGSLLLLQRQRPQRLILPGW